MPEPKKKSTSSRSGHRRAHKALKKLNLSKCPKCSEFVKPHFVCDNCGFYNDKKIIDLDIKK